MSMYCQSFIPIKTSEMPKHRYLVSLLRYGMGSDEGLRAFVSSDFHHLPRKLSISKEEEEALNAFALRFHITHAQALRLYRTDLNTDHTNHTPSLSR